MKAVHVYALLFAGCLFLSSCSDKQSKQTEEKAPAQKTDTNTRIAKNYFTDCKKLYKEARVHDSILLGQTEVDQPSAVAAIKAFTDYAFYCQSDTMSPVYLIKTAQVARAVNNIPQAKTALDRCIEYYPAFRNRPAALFLLAQLYDEPTYLNDEAQAKKLYEQIINEHPQSDWAASAKGAIQFLGKSDQQILEEFKRKQKKK